MSFESALTGNHQALPKIEIGGTTYHVKPWKLFGIESAGLASMAAALAHHFYTEAPDDKDEFSEFKPVKLGVIESVLDEQGYYSAKTKGEARKARAAMLVRNSLVYASCILDSNGKRPWWGTKPEQITEVAALCQLLQNSDELSAKIGVLSGITKEADSKVAEEPANIEATAPGN